MSLAECHGAEPGPAGIEEALHDGLRKFPVENPSIFSQL